MKFLWFLSLILQIIFYTEKIILIRKEDLLEEIYFKVVGKSIRKGQVVFPYTYVTDIVLLL